MEEQNLNLEIEQPYAGYTPSSERVSLVPEHSEQEQPQQEALSDVDLSMLDLPAEPQPTQQQQPEQQSQPDAEFESFSQQFQKYTGVDFKSAVNLMQEMQQFKAQQVVQQQESQLQQVWGVQGEEYTQRINAVRERFAKYPKDLQAKLDNVEGAQLIWAKLQQEQALGKSVPSLDRGAPAPRQTKYMYTEQQILKMSNDEYAKNAQRIAYAWQNGLVQR